MALWLEHWISVQGVLGSNSVRDVGFLQPMHHLLFTNFIIVRNASFYFTYADIHPEFAKSGETVDKAGFLLEPPHQKTNNLHMRKQRRRSALQ